MKFKLMLYCLIFIFLSSLVSAQVFDNYEHRVDLLEKNSLHEIEIRGAESFDLILPARFKDLVAPKECKVEEDKDYTLLRCDLNEVKISYSTTNPILRTGDNLIYKTEFIPINLVKQFSYSLKLPLGYVLPDETEFYVTPKPTRIESDGRRVVLVWEKKNVKDILEISVMMEPVAGYSRGSLWLVVFGLVLVGVVVGLVYYFKKPEEKVKYTALVENEKKVVDVLKKNKGVLWQKQIQIKTGFPKVKLSRVLHSLEKRGVVKKEPFGNTNKIYLVEK